MPLAPMKESDAPNEELRQAPGVLPHLARSIQQHRVTLLCAALAIITYDAYHMAEVYLTQPIQLWQNGGQGANG